MKVHAFLLSVGVLAAIVPASASDSSGQSIGYAAVQGSAALLERALNWQQAGNYAAAIADYSQALRSGEIAGRTAVIAHYNRGICQQKSGRDAAAIDDFTAAISLDATFAQAYQSRANVWLAGGRPDMALADYSRAIEHRHPEPQLALYGQARAYELLQDIPAARRALERAVFLAPGFSEARAELEKLTPDPEALSVPQALADTTVMPPAFVGALVPGMPTPDLLEHKLPDLVQAPQNLLDAAEMVVHSRFTVATLQTLTLSQTPALDGPGLVIADTEELAKDQDRVDQADAAILPTPKFIRVEAASETADAKPKQAVVLPQKARLSAYIVTGGAEKKEADAWKLWDKLKSGESQLLDGKYAEVVRTKLKGRPVYQLQINGLADRKSAQKLCRGLAGALSGCVASPRGT